jgi:hypothetical protein
MFENLIYYFGNNIFHFSIASLFWIIVRSVGVLIRIVVRSWLFLGTSILFILTSN